MTRDPASERSKAKQASAALSLILPVSSEGGGGEGTARPGTEPAMRRFILPTLQQREENVRTTSCGANLGRRAAARGQQPRQHHGYSHG